LDPEDVVVSREHVEGGRGIGIHTRLNLDGNLGVVDAGEVACTGRLMFLGLEGEGVRVNTGHGATRVVVEGLHGVEVLASLLLEPVLAVKHKLEVLNGANRLRGTASILLNEAEGGSISRPSGVERNTGSVGEGYEAVGGRVASVWVGVDHHISVTDVGGEVPKLGTSGRRGRRGEHELLDRVVVREADLLGLTDGEGINTSVLNLLDEVLMTLLRESTTLLGVEVHVVTPDLEVVCIEIGLKLVS